MSQSFRERLIRILGMGLGLLFLWASLEKIWYPGLFASSIANYRLLPLQLLHPAAIWLPWLEAVSGLALLINYKSRAANLIIAFLLTGFTLAILSAMFRGLDFNCGCFSQQSSRANLGILKVLENLGLLAISLGYEWLCRRQNSQPIIHQ